MRTSLLVLALFACAGCLRRNTVGAEPSVDSGVDSGAAEDAGIVMPPEGPIAEFEEALFGTWAGVYRFDRNTVPVRFTFGRDHRVKGCSEERCFMEGEYRVTDVLSDGSALIQGLYESGAAFIFADVVMRGDELTFLDARLGMQAELERVEQASGAEL